MFKLGIERSSDAVFLTDVAGKIIYVNPAFERIYGYSKEEAIGQTPRILKSGKLSNKVYAQFWKCLLNKEIVAGEIINKTRNGALVTIDASANPVLDSAGQLIGFLAIQRDITKRKIIENNERAKSEFLAGLVGLNGIGEICRLAFDLIHKAMRCDAGAIVLKKESNFDASFEVVYNFDTEEDGSISLKESPKIIELDSATRLAQAFRNGQKIIIHRSGDELKQIVPKRPTHPIFNSRLSTSLAYLPLKFGNRTVGILTAQSYSPDSYDEDAVNLLEFVATNLAMALLAVITSETLRESEERFRGIFENSTIGLYRTTPEGQILMANSALVRMLGFNSFRELATRNINQCGFHNSHLRKVFKEMVERLGVIHGLESSWMKSDGSYITVRESSRRVTNKDGKIIYYEGTVEDITERRRAEEALLESEERYRLLIENAHDAIIVIQDGKVVFGNRALLNIHGCTMEEIINRPFEMLIHPDDRELVTKNYLAMIAGKPVASTYSFRVLRKAGGARWVEINMVAIEWYNKEATIYFGRDITQRMETEKALRENEERFRTIFETGPLPMALSGESFEFYKANKAFCEMLGYTEEELSRLTFRDITHPDNLTDDIEAVRMVSSGELPIYRTEKRYLKKDGSVVWGSITLSRITDKEGRLSSMLAMVEDITERKAAENQLLIEKAYLEKLFESAPEAVVVVDNDSRIIRINSEFSRMFGWSSEEAIGKCVDDLLAPDMLHEDAIILSHKVSCGETINVEGVRHRKDGRPVFVSILSTPISSSGSQIAAYGIYRDITGRKKTETKINRINRVYSVLSAINEAIIRISDVNQLYEQSCQIAVELGGFRMAWVGLVIEQTGTIESVASGGNVDGYLKGIKIAATPNTYGQGPTGTCIRENRQVICDNIETDPRMAPWREEALKRGYLSSAAFPLRSGSRVFGTFNLYAGEPDFFSDDETHLLLALANDISFAVESIEREDRRMKAEEALRQSEQFLNTVFDGIQDGLSVLDRDLNILRYNKTTEERFAHSMPLVGKKCYQVYHGLTAPCQSCPTIRAIETGSPQVDRVPFNGANGPGGWLDVYTYPLVNENGLITGVIENVRDVTEQKAAEDLSRARTEFLSQLVGLTDPGELAALTFAHARNLMPIDSGALVISHSKSQYELVFSADTDADGRLTASTNRSHLPVNTGIPTDRVFTRGQKEIMHRTEEEARQIIPCTEGIPAFNQRASRSLSFYPLMVRGQTFGVFSFHSYRPDLFNEKLITILESIIADLSLALATVKITEALKESEEKYRNLIETMPNGLVIIDLDWKINFANRAACVIFGSSMSRITKLNLRDIITNESLPGFEQEMHRRRWGSNGEYEIQIRQSGDNIRTLFVTAAPLRNRAGEVIGSIGIFSDVTEIRKSEAEKQELRDKLARAQKMESLGILAGGVAHDLNNILGPLVAYPELIKMKLPPESPVINQISKIESSAQRAAEVVQDLLTMARRGRYEMKPVSINKVVNSYLQSADFLEMKSHFPNITVELGLHSENRLIYGSEPHLYKVIMNLVINALDAMPHGGTLTVKSECRQVQRLIGGFDNIDKGIYNILTVSDTGIGIDPTDIKRLFEPFYTKKSMGKSGSGLGLAIVYGIVKDHNGYVDICSELNKGSDFIIYIPTTTDSAQGEEEEPTTIRGKERILIVDDVQEQRELAVTILGILGYTAESVPNGHQALEFLKNTAVDVVVLDMIMEPGFDGLDTYKDILKIRPGQKAIITSGFSETERVKEAELLGVGKYIRKPYTMQKLGKAIREVLEPPFVISLK